MSDQGHWGGETADPYNNFGFIYLISDLTSGRFYVGKKQFWSVAKRKGCKSRVTDRQSDKWKCRCWQEMPKWREYKGSSPSLKKWMKENPTNNYKYEILYQCRSKGVLHYKELKELWSRDVLSVKMEDGEYLYFNRSIGAIKFRPPEFVSEETRKLLSRVRKDVPLNKEVVHLIHRDTREELKGNRMELVESTGLKYQSIIGLCNEEHKSLHGWVLYSRKDEVPFSKRGAYSEEHRLAISEGLKSSTIPSWRKGSGRIITFHHYCTGEMYTGTIPEMVDRYKLDAAALHRVEASVSFEHKGWINPSSTLVSAFYNELDEDTIISLYTSGSTSRDICSLLGISLHLVNKVLKREGLFIPYKNMNKSKTRRKI